MLDTLKTYDKVIDSLHGNIRTLKVYPKVFTASEHAYLHPFYDRALFGALSLLDLVVGLKYLHLSGAVGNQFEANYFARIVAHCIYETIQNQNKLVGKEVLDLIQERLGDRAADELKSNTRMLREIRKTELPSLRVIRNELFGHKLASGIKQAEKIVGVDQIRVYKIGRQVVSCQIEVLASYVGLMDKI